MGSILIKYSEKGQGRVSVLSSPDWLSGEVKTNRITDLQQRHKDKQTPEGLEPNPLLNFS